MPQDQQKTHTEVEVTEVNTQHAVPSDLRKSSLSTGLLAQVSTLAWNLVIPIVGGVLLGHYLDNRNDRGVTWTLSLLVLGIMIAFSNLYNLYIEHKYEYPEKKENKVTDKVQHAKEK